MILNVAHWVVRTVMLVLAGLVTLAILGSVDALSNEEGLSPWVATEPQLSVPESRSAPEGQPERQAPRTLPSEAPQSAQGAGEITMTPPLTEEQKAERWLKAIVYALLAIAGLLALLLILLWRGVRALSTIADDLALGHHRN